METEKLNPDELIKELKQKLNELLIQCLYDTPYFDKELHRERIRNALEALILCGRLEGTLNRKD